MHRWIVRFFQIGSVLMLLIAVALVAAVTTMHFVIHGAEVQVPSLKGMTVAEARSQAAGMGLDLDVDNRYYSGDVAAGHILSQSPPPGTVVRREWRVRVSESLGPQTVDVPDVVGRDEQAAALELRRGGMNVGATAKLPVGKAAAETVLAQDPPAHAKGIAQPSVNLLVAAASTEAPDGYVMPDLKGMMATGAQGMLSKVGVKSTVKFVEVPVGAVGTAGSIPRPPVAPATVIAQEPQAGGRVDVDAVVKLTAAK